MFRPTDRWRYALSACAFGLLASASGSGCQGEETASVDCQSTRQYFAERVWPVVAADCFGCHNVQGLARNTSYVLKDSSEAGFIDHNLQMISDVALFEKDGESRWLLKPTNTIDHKGGKVIDRGSDDYKAMHGLVVRLKNEDNCVVDESAAFTGVEMADARATLRKASLVLLGRLPTAEELGLIEEHGAAALDPILDRMMTEPAFLEFVKRIYGDLLQTDFYLSAGASQQIQSVYESADWYDDAPKELLAKYSLTDADELRNFTNKAIAREPLELIAHVVKNDLPFSEILTADYSMFSPLSAKSFGAVDIEFEDDSNPWEYATGRYPDYSDEDGESYGFPHAGILTSPMFLSRWPTTDTNRNRARARVFLRFFLGTDILRRGTRPTDTTKVTAINPQRDDPNCSMCHITVDPIAGCFQAFDDIGRWNSDPEWHAEMWPPGFGEAVMPLELASSGLRWLSTEAVQDERFALGAVHNVYQGLIGRPPLIAPNDFDGPLYGEQFRSFFAQANVFRAITEAFKASDMNFKVIVKEMLLSPYFRAVNSVALDGEQQAVLGEIGLGRFLTPEQLHQKINAVMGVPWRDPNNPLLVPGPRDSAPGEYQLYYGGVDFFEVTSRITEPNGLMAAVAQRMGNEVSCESVPADFGRIPENRRLFPLVDIDGVSYDPLDLVPESVGLEVPQAVEGIKRTLVHLHEHVLGERLTVGDAEIDRSYNLFLETWREGVELMKSSDESEQLSTQLPGACRATNDPFSGVPLSEELQVVEDPDFTVRAWMAVVTYLLTDYQFLYE